MCIYFPQIYSYPLPLARVSFATNVCIYNMYACCDRTPKIIAIHFNRVVVVDRVANDNQTIDISMSFSFPFSALCVPVAVAECVCAYVSISVFFEVTPVCQSKHCVHCHNVIEFNHFDTKYLYLPNKRMGRKRKKKNALWKVLEIVVIDIN